MNETKTEEYEIKQNKNELWRKCKLLGRLLNMDKAISQIKSLRTASVRNLKHTFYNRKLSIGIKTRTFNNYAASIFLYYSKSWTLIETKEKAINSFQRGLLRTACMNSRWPKKSK